MFRRKGDSKSKSKNELVCTYCNLEFTDKEHLERHKKVAHKKGR